MSTTKKGHLGARSKLMGVMAEVNKKFGEATMKQASRVAFSHLTRVSSGVFGLDVDIGGGIPKGRIIMLRGFESVAKTTLCLLIAAQYQHTCRECLEPFKWYTDEEIDPATGEVVRSEFVLVEPCPCGKSVPHVVAYFDSEGTLDPFWAAALGVDVPSLILTQPEWAEQGADVMNAMLRTGELDLLVVDSIANMTPGREIEQSAESGQRPDLALIMNRLMRTFQSSLNSLGMDYPYKPTILLVNQFREKVGVMYGPTETIPGGHGQRYASSITIDLRGGKRIDSKGVPGGKTPPYVGVQFHYDITKNKTFVPFKKGTFDLYVADAPLIGRRKGEVNNFEMMVGYATNIGLIKKSGAWYDLTETFGEEFANPDSKNGSFQGMERLIEFLKEDPKRVKAVREKAIHAARMESNKSFGDAGDDD